MKIYRAAETKKKKENAYTEVDDIDLSEESESWTFEKKIEEINITKEPQHRESVIKIVFTEKDIVALHEGLLRGWQEKLANYEKLSEELNSHKWFLSMIVKDLKFYLNISSKGGKSEKEVGKVKKILSSIENHLEKKSKN